MNVSKASRDTLQRIAQNGGSIECLGNWRQGRALERRGLVKIKAGRFIMTPKGRKWLDKD